jgi:hypothetical protein
MFKQVRWLVRVVALFYLPPSIRICASLHTTLLSALLGALNTFRMSDERTYDGSFSILLF